jgi:hypothetical protein
VAVTPDLAVDFRDMTNDRRLVTRVVDARPGYVPVEGAYAVGGRRRRRTESRPHPLDRRRRHHRPRRAARLRRGTPRSARSRPSEAADNGIGAGRSVDVEAVMGVLGETVSALLASDGWIPTQTDDTESLRVIIEARESVTRWPCSGTARRQRMTPCD